MTRDEIIRRGSNVARILADADCMSALGEIEADLLTQWANTREIDTLQREAIYRQVKALDC